jgi:hypothetical protein
VTRIVRHRALLIVALTIDLLAAIALAVVTSFWVSWLLFSLICADTGVIVYAVWQLMRTPP